MGDTHHGPYPPMWRGKLDSSCEVEVGGWVGTAWCKLDRRGGGLKPPNYVTREV